MHKLKEKLLEKIKGPQKHVSEIVKIVSENISADVLPYILKGIENVEEILLALPFTKYGWLLAIYEAYGKTEDSKIIVYFNSENPYWTASIIIHELIHKSLDIKCKIVLDTIVDETLAYLASFKLGFLKLYDKSIRETIELLSQCKIIWEKYDYQLINIFIPRILAKELIEYGFNHVVKEAMTDFSNLMNLWLKRKPSRKTRKALATALVLIGINPEKYGLEKITCKPEIKPITNISQEIKLEGVDSNFLKMIKILEEIIRNPEKLKEILAPWWNEIEPILDDLKAYIIYKKGIQLIMPP